MGNETSPRESPNHPAASAFGGFQDDDREPAASLSELLSDEHRDTVRDLAEQMRESGVLRIKLHREMRNGRLGAAHNSFKGEYAMEWVAANVSLCRTEGDCVALLQRMMALGIFHNVYNEPAFQPTKGLYSFSKEGRGMLPLLRQRIVAAEDQILGQIKTFNQAHADTTSRLVQLDWRVSVAEQRAHAGEVALRRGLVAQQLLMGTVLAAAVLRYVPLPDVAVESASAVSVVLLAVALLESRVVLMQFLGLRIDYRSLARTVMGLASETTDDGTESIVSTGDLDARQAPLQRSAPSDLRECVPRSRVAVGAYRVASRRVTALFAPAGPARSHDGRATFSGAPTGPPTGAPAASPTASDSGRALMRTSAPSLLAEPNSIPVLPMPPAPASSHTGAAAHSGGSGASPSATPTRQLAMRHSSPQGAVRSGDEGGSASNPDPDGTAPPGPPQSGDFRDWQGGDILVRMPAGPARLRHPEGPAARVRVNNGEAHEFDGPLFAGRISIYLRDIAREEGGRDVFEGRKRQSWVIVQGRFKRPVATSDVFTGQSFSRPLTGLPPFVARIAQTIIGSFNRLVSSATVMSDAEGSQCIMYPLILGAQAVHVARAGAAPSMDAEAEQEDVALLVPELAAEAAQSGESADRARLAHFSKDANRKATHFSPEHVYTFHIRQHVVDIVHFRVLLPIPMWQPGLARHLDGQPLRFMAVHRTSGEHFWNFEAWHRDLLEAARKHHAEDVRTGAVAPPRSGHARARSDTAAAELVKHGSIDELGADMLAAQPPLSAGRSLSLNPRPRTSFSEFGAHRDAFAEAHAVHEQHVHNSVPIQPSLAPISIAPGHARHPSGLSAPTPTLAPEGYASRARPASASPLAAVQSFTAFSEGSAREHTDESGILQTAPGYIGYDASGSATMNSVNGPGRQAISPPASQGRIRFAHAPDQPAVSRASSRHRSDSGAAMPPAREPSAESTASTPQPDAKRRGSRFGRRHTENGASASSVDTHTIEGLDLDTGADRPRRRDRMRQFFKGKSKPSESAAQPATADL